MRININHCNRCNNHEPQVTVLNLNRRDIRAVADSRRLVLSYKNERLATIHLRNVLNRDLFSVTWHDPAQRFDQRTVISGDDLRQCKSPADYFAAALISARGEVADAILNMLSHIKTNSVPG